MFRLLLLFILVPTVELALLIEIGRRIGTLQTLGLIAVTGTAGASLARWQGLSIWRQMHSELADGKLPTGPVVDGVIILVAGALLITPGALTDVFGFLCLIPAFRRLIKSTLRRRFEQTLRDGQVHVVTGFVQRTERHFKNYRE